MDQSQRAHIRLRAALEEAGRDLGQNELVSLLASILASECVLRDVTPEQLLGPFIEPARAMVAEAKRRHGGR